MELVLPIQFTKSTNKTAKMVTDLITVNNVLVIRGEILIYGDTLMIREFYQQITTLMFINILLLKLNIYQKMRYQ